MCIRDSSYAKGLANASIDPVAALDYRTAGLPHVALLQRLAREKEAGVEEVSAALAEIAAFALARNRVMRCRISAKPEACDPAVKQMEAFIDALPLRGADAVGDELTLAQSLASFAVAPSKTFVATPTQTNYCAASYLTVPYSHPDSAPLFLLGQAMSTSFLHREIREKGGAYGGGASAAPVEGVFVLSSYRDPNTTATVETFEKAATWAAKEGNLTQEILEEAWLKAFKAIDAPLAPQSRGASLFTNLMDDESRQLFRDRLLDCTPGRMRECAEKYLVGKTPALAIVGNPASVPDVKKAGWTCVDAEGNPLKEE